MESADPKKNKRGGRGRRRKGFGFEREVVKAFSASGHQAERMYGSNGQSRGLPHDVDVVAGSDYFQCKRMKSLPQYLTLTDHLTGVIVREDRGEALVLIRLDHYLRMLPAPIDNHNDGNKASTATSLQETAGSL